ncbi:Holliday junction resolvase RuvX [Candidatus Woesebacteria bacterium CG07_land_8_20_14_0_80_44_9]|uniref:Putative pre-16S rRNA nuclease n=2 Tax=Candidatus Woeseibacteriota TaxID=1752722 RepID=A0A2M6YEB7_9BACT|nr:MAG: Holliday junction resolvase RuvX [Candidatus Woesebacteria bacterium CG07_land_8_20_14_0_80_44_9]PIZ45743.1 MAG: Holliday junction resolvase RuvX [Candidatus Woesebacteria bacterium CG_4_10_14_0_2_um_filter_44_9]
MKILGIDYGRKKIGLAVSGGKLAEPLKVIRYRDIKILSEKLQKIVKENNIEKIVVGVSEGEMGEESKKFALAISHQPLAIVETFDETLSTHEAKKLSLEAGISRGKRRGLEDAFAAAVMLQSYLDSYV